MEKVSSSPGHKDVYTDVALEHVIVIAQSEKSASTFNYGPRLWAIIHVMSLTDMKNRSLSKFLNKVNMILVNVFSAVQYMGLIYSYQRKYDYGK